MVGALTFFEVVEAVLHDGEEFCFIQLEVVGGHDGLVDFGHEHFASDLFTEGGLVFADEAAAAWAGFDDPLGFEFGVGFGDGVAVNAQLFGERADGGEGVTWVEGG
ncbi:MAG: hypothetical protein RI897_3843 [Verrucomicrobiota bacterium]